jgi:hypothetical protein
MDSACGTHTCVVYIMVAESCRNSIDLIISDIDYKKLCFVRILAGRVYLFFILQLRPSS